MSESQGSCFLFSDLWETRSPKTREHVSTSGCMLGAVRGDGCNLVQGQVSQFCGTGGVTGSGRHTGSWSHGVDTKLGRVENSGTCGRRNRWGDQRDTDRCTALREDTEAGVCSVGVWTEETFILGVGPTFYTSLLDGGGVVSLGVHRVAEARGGVSMRWVKAWLSFSTWGGGATRPVL